MTFLLWQRKKLAEDGRPASDDEEERDDEQPTVVMLEAGDLSEKDAEALRKAGLKLPDDDKGPQADTARQPELSRGAGIMKRRRAENLAYVLRIAEIRNPVDFHRISMIRSTYGKFAALQRFIIPASGLQPGFTTFSIC